jgi:hypothetical protein
VPPEPALHLLLLLRHWHDGLLQHSESRNLQYTNDDTNPLVTITALDSLSLVRGSGLYIIKAFTASELIKLASQRKFY